MNYYIQAYTGKDQGLIGTQNQALVKDAKTQVKVNNRLKWFNPDPDTKQVKVFSYTNLYNESTYKLIRTIDWQEYIRNNRPSK